MAAAPDAVARGAAGVAAARLAIQAGLDADCATTGASMLPTIPPNVIVRVRGVGVATVRRGDVVAFAAGDTLVAHRVVAIARDSGNVTHVLTRGDAVTICDVPVPTADVLGLVTHIRVGAGLIPLAPSVRRPGWRGPASAVLDRIASIALVASVPLATATVRIARVLARARG